MLQYNELLENTNEVLKQKPPSHNVLIPPEKSLADLKAALRWLSLSRLESFTGKTGVILAEDDSPTIVKAHWMCLIIGVGYNAYVTIWVQYMSNDLLAYIDNNALNENRVKDFGKELCNLVLGGFKILLGKNNISIGTSLPFATRGFDAVYFPKYGRSQKIDDKWKLTLGSSTIYCSSSLEIFHPFDYVFDKSQLESVEGSVELL